MAAATVAALGGAVAGGCYLSDRDYFHANLSADDAEDVDALIIGGGIMGTTVAVMLKLKRKQAPQLTEKPGSSSSHANEPPPPPPTAS